MVEGVYATNINGVAGVKKVLPVDIVNVRYLLSTPRTADHYFLQPTWLKYRISCELEKWLWKLKCNRKTEYGLLMYKKCNNSQ